MRPPVTRLVQAYGAGLWVGLTFFPPLPPALILAVTGLWAAGSGHPVALMVGTGGLGLLTGTLARLSRRGDCARVWPPGPHVATVLIGDAPGPSGLTTATVRATPGNCGGVLKLRVASGGVAAGATAVIVGSYSPPAAFRVAHARVLASHRAWRFVVRERLAARFTQLYGERAGLVHALTLGRREDIDAGIRRAFADAGLAHLLAISGLHVGFLTSWVALVAGWFVSRRRASVVAATACWLYVGLLGFPPPATRAATFVTIRTLSLIRQRHPSGTTVLHVSALVVLGVEPGAITDVGAWLSFAAVWGTAWVSRVVPMAWRRHTVLQLVATSVGATIATAPVTAYVFGSVSLIGIVANVLAIPLSAVAVPGVFASAASATLAGGVGLALAVLEQVARFAARVPGARVTGSPGAAFALPWLAALAIGVWISSAAGLRVVRRHRSRLAAAGAAAWVLTVFAFQPVGTRGRQFEMHVLDVGQGDAIAIRSPGGRWIMVDGGPRTPRDDAGRRVVLPFLRRHGVRQLDLLVVTHGDADHLGGVPVLTRALDPGLVLEPGQPLGTPLYLEHLVAVDEGGIRWSAARVGDSVVMDSVVVTVLHPSAAWIASELEPNENSVVLRVRYRGFVAVLAGDAGHAVEDLLGTSVGHADVLKVGHHGSAGSTSEPWLDVVRPTVAVISVGENRYGHPDPGVVRRMGQRGTAVYRTDRGGTVTVRSDGSYLEITQGDPKTWLEALPCHVWTSLRSSDSSSSRNACTPRRRASFPTSSTTSPSRPRSSPGT